MISTVKELFEYMRGRERVWLYGAGKRAEHYLYCCGKSGIPVEGILVSARENNPFEKDGRPVLTLEELAGRGVKAEELNIVVTMAGGAKKWVDVFWGKPRFKSLVFPADKVYAEMCIQELKFRYEEAQDRYDLLTDYPLVEEFQGVLAERNSGRIVLRVPQFFGLGLLQPLVKYASCEEFEEEFGPLTILSPVKKTGITASLACQEKIEVYVVTSHLDRSESGISVLGGYLPIQAGAALTEIRKGCLTDDTGDNISGRNRNYCECTALYWIWKNTSGQNYVGLCHYRRRLMLDDRSVEYLKQHGIDLVAAHPQFEAESVKDFFQQYISCRDWELLKQEIENYDPSYAVYFERYERGRYYFPCNVALWKRNWFDRYCEFAFSVVERIEAFYRDRGIIREDRYIGYLFEQLSTVFIMRHYNEMNVVCSQIEWMK